MYLSKSVDSHIESDPNYLSETSSRQTTCACGLYRIIVSQENDNLTRTDNEQLLRGNNPL